MKLRNDFLIRALVGGAFVLSLAACQEKKTAQTVGEKLDDAKDKVADTINPKGPIEKAGRAIDRAMDDK